MNPTFERLMRDAAQFTRQGDLHAATAAIQSALSGRPFAGAAANEDLPLVIDIEAREVRARQPVEPGEPVARPGRPGWRPQDDPSANEPMTQPKGQFITGRHTGTGGSRDYKLFIPPQAARGDALPLIVMLHGCTQTPDDFALGTRMNEAAVAQGFFVLYPAQSQQANPQRCWNWFKHSHQARGRGEPALGAGMTQEALARHPIDPARVYVAGLSAGGAMAAILGEAYPDLFAAVGVHSGLAAGAARDLPSALGAMKSGAAPTRHAPSGVPTIVFHGDADSTVHPGNGAQVVAAAAGTTPAGTVHRERSGGGRQYTRHVHPLQEGGVSEHWVVHGGSHAWFGGSSQGSYTDPKGPDATSEMLRFFREHPRGRGTPVPE
jgi:poly(hydroxyalkanoate) depolymerase family esterase